MRTLKQCFIILICLCILSCKNPHNTINNLPQSQPKLIKAKGDKNYGGNLNLNIGITFRSLDPHNITDHAAYQVGNQIFEGLLKYNLSTLEVMPCLAKSWEANDSKTKYTFHLRTDVFFHEDKCFGDNKTRKFTANDVKYCFTRIFEPRKDNAGYYFFINEIKGAKEYFDSFKDKTKPPKKFEGINVINDSTIEFFLKSPSLDFTKTLITSAGWIFPKEAIDYYKDNFKNNLVGTGPFKVEKYQEDTLLKLKKNNLYWDFDNYGNKKPLLNGINIGFNHNKRDEIIDFRKGKIDLVWAVPVGLINDILGDIEEAQKGNNISFKTKSQPIMEVDFYGFNNRMPPFDNVLVRKAFKLAIDKEKLVVYYLKGEGLPANYGFVPPSIPFYPFNKIKNSKYNPSLARELLKKAGYNKKNKFPKINLQFDANKKNRLLSTYVQKSLKENLGIEIELKETPRRKHFMSIGSDSVLFWKAAWVADYPSPSTFLIQFYSGFNNLDKKDQFFIPNSSNYENLEFDTLYLKCLKQTNLEDRMDCFVKLDQLITNHAAIIPLIYQEKISLYNLRVQNYQSNSMGLWDFSEVYLKTNKSYIANPLQAIN